MQNKEEKKLAQIYKWNPWTGCHQKSTGCLNCSSAQFYSEYYQTITLDLGNFDLPLQRNKKGQYYIPKNSLIALEYNSDFFIQDMDFFRPYIWNIIKIRQDCHYYISTKRPERIEKCLPKDWGKGWDNVDISCTAETQKIIEERLPIYLNIPLRQHQVLVEPLIEEIDLSKFLQTGKIDNVDTQGEYITDALYSYQARPCNYKWVKKLADQCKQYNVQFSFSVVGTHWINENGEEEFLSPYGWDIKDRANSYNFATGNVLDLPTDYYEFKYINKEE